MTKMPPAGYPAFLQYLQSGRVRSFRCLLRDPQTTDRAPEGEIRRKACGDRAVARLTTGETGFSILVAVLRRDLLPPTAYSKLPKNESSVLRSSPNTSGVYNYHHSLT